MSKGSVSSANKEMAKHLKERGVTRTTCNCPICHRRVGLSGLENHIRTCQG
jgi:hypothetical protein